MASSFPSSNSCAFLALPLEIRRQIYRYYIPQKLRIDINKYYHHGWESDDVSLMDSESGEAGESDHLTDTDDEEIIYEHSVESVIQSEDGEEDEHKLSTNADDEEIIYESSVDDDCRSAFPGLLLCCRQITGEVTDMLYEENAFQVKLHGDGQVTLAHLFSSKTREKIRKLVLILRPMGVSYNPDFRMDPNIWDNILGKLSLLRIIAEQPSLANGLKKS